MKLYDIALFEVDKDLQRRLGYTKILSAGKDVAVLPAPKHSGMPVIVSSENQNILFRAIKDNEVIGIIFAGEAMNKRLIEAASEAGKKIFIPISSFISSTPSERQVELSKARKLISAAHSLRADAALVTLAKNPDFLLSASQLAEISNLIISTKNKKFSLLYSDIYDN